MFIKLLLYVRYCHGLYILLVEETVSEQNDSSTGKRVVQRMYVQQATHHGEETSLRESLLSYLESARFQVVVSINHQKEVNQTCLTE